MEIVISLLLFLGDPPVLKEHLYIQDQRMSTCLKMKRTVERSVNPQNVRMACGDVDAVLEVYMGSTKIVKIVRDKYNNY